MKFSRVMDNLVCFQAGLDHEGKGRIYGYDPVGCVEELNQCSGGAGVTLMQSLLDNQVKNCVENALFCFSLVFLSCEIVLFITELCLLDVSFDLYFCVFKV